MCVSRVLCPGCAVAPVDRPHAARTVCIPSPCIVVLPHASPSLPLGDDSVTINHERNPLSPSSSRPLPPHVITPFSLPLYFSTLLCTNLYNPPPALPPPPPSRLPPLPQAEREVKSKVADPYRSMFPAPPGRTLALMGDGGGGAASPLSTVSGVGMVGWWWGRVAVHV